MMSALRYIMSKAKVGASDRRVSALRRQFLRAAKCESGMAAAEFALLLPIMIFMFFGLVEGSDALQASRRVSLSVNTLADLAAQATEISPQNADDLFTGVERMLEPNTGVNVSFNLLSIVLVDDEPVIHWSVDNNGDTPYVAGAPYTNLEDETVLDEDASLIIVELVYPHQTSMASHVFDSTITFNKRAARWPRQSTRVQYCVTPGNCTS